MGFIGWVILLIVLAAICRALRSVFKAVDWIVFLLIFAAFIIVWITEGFWMGLIILFIGSAIAGILFGIGGGTEVHKFGYKYTLTCDKCGYDHLEIIDEDELGVTTRCKRCGDVQGHILRH